MSRSSGRPHHILSFQSLKQHIDGRSLTSALKNPSATAPDRPLFWHYPHWGNQGGTPGTAVRLGDWKLIRYLVPGRKAQLFNLAKDPGEQHNVIAKHSAKARQLTKIMDGLVRDTDALMPTPNPNYKQK